VGREYLFIPLVLSSWFLRSLLLVPPGGIKVSSVELERAVTEGVPSVAEAAAIAIPTPGGGPEQLVLFLVLHQSKGEPWADICMQLSRLAPGTIELLPPLQDWVTD
jgi:acyl-coenzyme A synthetase/AMP-(fatty) acid ligase